MARTVLDEPPPLTPAELRNFPYQVISWPITGDLRYQVGLGADESAAPFVEPTLPDDAVRVE